MIQNLTDQTLIEKTGRLFEKERLIGLEVLLHLQEIDRRKLYLKKYPSFFAMCVSEFKCSEAAAQNRISAMLLLKDVPEAAPKIQSGELTMTTLQKTQVFFNAERKAQRVYTAAEKRDLLLSFENKSTREVEKVLVAKNPAVKAKETVRAISETQSSMNLIIPNELRETLDQLKDLMAHSNPSMTYVGLIEVMAKEMLKKKLSATREKTITPKSTDGKLRRKSSAPPAKRSVEGSSPQLQAPEVKLQNKRYISPKLKRKIWTRDESRCTHVDRDSGARCQAKAFLQIDHIKPYGIGGETTEENLRLLCASHNRARIQQTFF